MNDITQFLWQPVGSFMKHSVRAVMKDGEPWFVGKDVADLLGYTRPADAVRTHCKGVAETTTPSRGGPQTVKIIPERDVYRLIMRSKLPAAEQFEEWVVGTVLPSLRKNGGYIVGQEQMSEVETMAAGLLAAQRIIESERVRRLSAEASKQIVVEQLDDAYELIEELRPEAEAWRAAVHPTEGINLREFLFTQPSVHADNAMKWLASIGLIQKPQHFGQTGWTTTFHSDTRRTGWLLQLLQASFY